MLLGGHIIELSLLQLQSSLQGYALISLLCLSEINLRGSQVPAPLRGAGL
jgi:hypothetical protein